MAATALILGFWFDVLTAKFRPQLARRTKIVSFVGAALLLLLIPGIVLALTLGQSEAGYAITVLPLFVDSVGLVVLTIIVSQLKLTQADVSRSTHGRRLYALRLFILLSCAWIIYFVTVLASAILVGQTDQTPFALSYFAITFAARISDSTLAVGVIALSDRGGNPFLHTRRLCSGEPADIKSASTLDSGLPIPPASESTEPSDHS